MEIMWQPLLGLHHVPALWVTRLNGTRFLVLGRVHCQVRSAVVPGEVCVNWMTAANSRGQPSAHRENAVILVVQPGREE